MKRFFPIAPLAVLLAIPAGSAAQAFADGLLEVSVREIWHTKGNPGFGYIGGTANDPRGLPCSVSHEEQSAAALRHAEVGGVQHMFPKVKAEVYQSVFQLTVAWPGAHMDDVLQNQPSGAQHSGVLDDEHGGGAARLVARGSSPGTAMARAFRRRQQKVDLADCSAQAAEANVFQTVDEDLGGREVRGKRRARDAAHAGPGLPDETDVIDGLLEPI